MSKFHLEIFEYRWEICLKVVNFRFTVEKLQQTHTVSAMILADI